jgi:serine protease Do
MFSTTFRRQRTPVQQFFLATLAIGFLVADFHAAQAEQPRDIPSKTSSRFLSAFKQVVAGASRSTVRVQCDGKSVALGTVVAADGWVLTKASELKGTPVCKLSDGRALEARVVGVHEVLDLALLKVNAGDLTPVTFFNSKEAEVGVWLASCGTNVEALAVGVVSVATRTLSSHEAGPIKAPPGGFLGINMEPADQGPRVSRLQPDSPASKAGMKADDIITGVDDKAVDKPEALQRILQSHKPGDHVRLKIVRGEQELELNATLAKRPIVAYGDTTSTLGGRLSERRTGFTDVLQHDTVLRPEDCGGPLVDLEGHVVGINIARAARVETLAIPAEAIQSVLADLKSGKLAPEGARTTIASTSLPPVPEKVNKPKPAKQDVEKGTAEKKTIEAKTTPEKPEAGKVKKTGGM